MKHVPTPQPKTSGEEKQNAGCCGVFPPARRGVGWELALVPDNARERRGPVRDSSGLFQMLPRGHRDTEGFSKGSSTFLELNTKMFRSRSTDVSSTLQFRGCLLPHGSPVETSTTACNESTGLGISASSFRLLSLFSLLLLFQYTKMLLIQKGNHCWIRAAQPPFPSSSLQANR